eukprot:3086385-Rhodomonas_salina.2
MGDTTGEDGPTALADRGRKGAGSVHRRVREGPVQRTQLRHRGHDPGLGPGLGGEEAAHNAGGVLPEDGQ